MENEKIPNIILGAMAKHLNIDDSVKSELEFKLTELKQQFLSSEATVYCEDCGLTFYYGLAKPVATEKDFVDWKMLSFRHVWDTKHKVKIYMPFFSVADKMLESKNTQLVSMIKRIRRDYLGFDEVNQVCYYLEVEKLRERLSMLGDVCANRPHDANWDSRSRCVCSVCHRPYYDPKQACLCHGEVKPWLPMDEVNGIMVKRR